MIKTKKDKIALAVLIIVALIISFTWVATYRKNKNYAKDASVYSLTKTDSNNIKNVINEYLQSAGNYGVNYDKMPKEDYEDMYSYYSLYSVSGADIPSTLTPYVKTRYQAYNDVTRNHKVMDPASALTGKTQQELLSNSDASKMTEFKLDSSSIKITDPDDSEIRLNGEDEPIATVPVSWKSIVTQIDSTPGDPGDSKGGRQQVKWSTNTSDISFSNVGFTMVKTKQGWRINDIGAGAASSSVYGKNDWVLATSNDIQY